MSSILDFLAFRQIGCYKSKKYINGKKAVLDLLEYEAAKPTNNEPCDFSGEPRATFLVDFSPNMLRAASTHGDHSVRVTDVETGKCTHVLTGHPRTPWCLAFNPTSNDILASGCLGGEVRIWDLLGGGSEVLHNPSLGAVITSLAFHPSGQVLVFATINCIYFWDWSKPTPFAVTKTSHEYERIRWLRFDPFGKYLYTGIANNITLHRERARNVTNPRARESESRDDRQSRVLLLRNRFRYHELMQRFRHFQSQNQRPEYPENLRPRSPVHEENLNLARQYANHITERVNASLLNDTRQRIRERRSRSGIIRDGPSQLGQDQRGDEPSQLGVYARTEGERLSNSRGWGRYQPSFFTSASASASASANDSNNNSNSSSSVSALNGSARQQSVRPARLRSANRPSTVRMAPYSVRGAARSSRLGRMRNTFDSSSSSSSSSQTSSSTSSSSDDFESNNHPEELEPDEFEILPVEQNDSGSANVSGNGEGREFDGMSASEMAQRLEQQLRQLRRELCHLTQRNLDINNAIMTLPNHGSSQSSARTSAEASESSNVRRSAFRSAGSALSRSIFSRSGSNYSSTLSSTIPSSSSILSSALSATSSSPSSHPSTASRLERVSSNLAMLSRSSLSTSNVPYLSYSAITGATRGSNSSLSSSLSTNLTTPSSNLNERSILDFPSSERQSARVTDSTSQTFGAMNLPERLDQSTDMSDSESEQCDIGSRSGAAEYSLPSLEASRSVDTTHSIDGESNSTDVDISSNSEEGLGQNNNECRNVSPLTQQPPSLHISTSTHAGTAQTQLSTGSSLPATSTHCSVPSLGILRSALTASSSSSLFPPISTSSVFFPRNDTNRALYASSNNLSSTSMTRSTGSTSSRPSALNDRRVFRSISNLRNSLSNIMSEDMLRSQVVVYNGERIPLNSVLPQPENSSSETGSRDVSSGLSSTASTTATSTSGNEGSTSVPATSSETRQANVALRRSIANVQRRISDVLHNIRTNHARSVSSNLGVEAMDRLREVEDRFLSQTSQVLSQTTAYWTEFLGRSVMELNQRISELERRAIGTNSRLKLETKISESVNSFKNAIDMELFNLMLETNQYLLSSTNPFSHQRPGRPQDALMSSLFRNRTVPDTDNDVDRPSEGVEERSTSRNDDLPMSSMRNDDLPMPSMRNDDLPMPSMRNDDLPMPSMRNDDLPMSSMRNDDLIPPGSVPEGDPPAGDPTGDHETSVRRAARGQIQRNQLLLDFLVWRSSRDSQSQRTLSFGQSVSSGMSSSSSTPSMSVRAPILSSTLSAAATTSASSSTSSSVPLSVTIHPSRDEDSDDEIDDDEEEEMMREREEGGNRRGGDEGGGGDSSWLGLQHIHLHADYSSSILDDTINRPNETMQHIMNRTIAGVLEREDQAVASNIIPQTHRIQRWRINDVIVPNIARVNANIVVEQCKLHNDASCDISKDGTTLATFVPSHRGFPDDNILGVFSLRNETFAQCLYTKSFGPNAISVSISPANHYVMVGLAARRYFLFSLSNKMVGQVYKLVNAREGEKSMKHVTDLFHPRARGVQLHISVNFGRWLPGIGEGIVYGTNRGDLHFCRPGPRRVPEPESTDTRSHLTYSRGRRSSHVRSSIATQTTTVSIRRTASTQTQGDEDGAGPSR